MFAMRVPARRLHDACGTPLEEEQCMSQAYMSQDQILDLGRRWADAELRADVEALDGLLDADFVCVGPLGFVLNKEQYLGARRSGDLKQEAFGWQDVQVRVYGQAAAVAIGTEVQKTTYQRSEERRVGKSVELGGGGDVKKK